MMLFLQTLTTSIFEAVSKFGMDLVKAILILVIGFRLSKFAVKYFKKFMESSMIDDSVGSFLTSIIRIGTKALVVVLAVMQMGVQPAAFVTVLASAGVAIGLALQGSLSNIAGGCLILLTRPFTVGDYIREDGHGNEGTVIGIDLFYTRIKTVDNKIIVVPNGVITSNSLTNDTHQEERFLDLRVGISYEDDLLKAKEVLKNAAISSEYARRTDETLVFVDELGESSINLGLRVWVPTDSYHPSRWDINERIKLAFDKEGINIPYNQLDIHMK